MKETPATGTKAADNRDTSPWFGRYELLNPLRRTTNTERYRARLMGPGGFEKICVIERLSKDASAHATLAEAFKRAAQRVAVLHHPNLVEIYELGVIDGQYYAATELVDGPSLAEVLDEHQRTLRPFDLALGLEVLDALCNVLICIHNAPGPDGRRGSITHGGLTPERVVLTHHGFIKLFDVGQAEGDVMGVGEDIQALGQMLTSFLAGHQSPPLVLNELRLRLENHEFTALEDLQDALRSAAFEARLKPWDKVAQVVMESDWKRSAPTFLGPKPSGMSVYRLRGQTGETLGDLDHHNFEQLVLAQAVSPSDEVSVNGGAWQPAEKLAEFGELTRCLIKLPDPNWSAKLGVDTLLFGLSQMALRHRTGALKFQWGNRLKQFYFDQGVAIGSTSTLKRELLGPALVSAEIVSRSDLAAASRHMELTGMKLGSALVALGACGRDELDRELTRQLHSRLADIAGWKGGSILFVDQEASAIPTVAFNIDGLRLAQTLTFDSISDAQVARATDKLRQGVFSQTVGLKMDDPRLLNSDEVSRLFEALTEHGHVSEALTEVAEDDGKHAQRWLRALLWLIGTGVFQRESGEH